MKLQKYNMIGVAIVAVLWLVAGAGCAPQARYFNVDVRNDDHIELPLDGKKIAVFSIIAQNVADSVRLNSVSLGLAEKIEEDRGLNSGDVAVYSVPKIDFRGFPSRLNDDITAVDTAYIAGLMLSSGARILCFTDNFRFGQYSVQQSIAASEYDNVNVVVPYFIDFFIYDAFADKLLFQEELRDSIYMHMLSSSVKDNNIGGVIANYLPEIARKVGEKLGSHISVQWDTQERMLISYEGNSEWETPYMLSQDFKWREAIKGWMPLTECENPKKTAYAAYNIAVGCEMLEEFGLARKWLEFSLKKYRFQEALMMYEHIKERTKSQYIQ